MAASFSYDSRTDTSITIRVSPDSAYPYYKIFWRPTTTTTAETSAWLYRTSSFTYVITGLSPSTAYVINVGYARTASASGADGFCGSTTIWTDDPPAPPKPHVDKWSWYASSARQTALSAVQNNGNTSDFSYSVWNELCEKVRELRTALGVGAWDNYYASYSSTTMSWSDKTLTAMRFNSLRYNIGSQYSTGIQEVSRGDTVYGYYFTTLADCINGWIDREVRKGNLS